MSYLNRAAATRNEAIASKKSTPQSEPIPGRKSEMAKNAAGGYVFPVNDWVRLRRFLILGTEGGTYYASQRALTTDNVEAIIRCIREDGPRVVAEITDVSVGGHAPKNDPALYALALCFALGNEAAKDAANIALREVARIGTHLLMFVSFVRSMRGMGRAVTSAVCRWYFTQEPDALAYQVAKYWNREGYTHRDVFRLAHPDPGTSPARQALYKYIAKDVLGDETSTLIRAIHQVRERGTKIAATVAIKKYQLTREMIPTQFQSDPEVQRALLAKMPLTALLRNLGNLTRTGALVPMSGHTNDACFAIMDSERITKSRIHPVAVLAATLTYKSGHGVRGSGEWTPIPSILNALERAFVLSWGNLPPVNKRVYVGIDVSGSMNWGEIAGVPNLTPRVAAACMALVFVKQYASTYTAGFTGSMQDLAIHLHSTLNEIIIATESLVMGSTDCALPMMDARAKGIGADLFVILTDNETWYGTPHPCQALQAYRNKVNPAAKLAVVAMTSSGFTIADPADAGMMDVVGFDTATPALIADFAN